jgi:hypothetical protein
MPSRLIIFHEKHDLITQYLLLLQFIFITIFCMLFVDIVSIVVFFHLHIKWKLIFEAQHNNLKTFSRNNYA